MLGRLAYAVGLAVAIALASCYDVPQPECGFTCGPPAVIGGEGACPSGYICAEQDNRCHRIDPPFTDPCPGDAGTPIDLTPPQVDYRSPAPGATDVPGTTMTVEVGFTEPVFGIDQTTFTVEDPNGVIQQLDFFSGPDVVNRYQYVTLIPLAPETAFTVRLTAGIRDGAGNSLVPEEWSFTTVADNTAPMATVQNPLGMTNVSISTTIDVVFSEVVVGVTSSTFTLSGPSGLVGANITAFSPTTSASLDPFVNLAPNTQYTISLSTAITDFAGNPLVFTPVQFTTAADTTRPQVTSTNPASGSTNVGVGAAISVGFTEQVTGINSTTFTLTGPSGSVTANVTAAASSASLDPIHQLLPFTAYSFALSTAIVDLATNPLIAFTGTLTTGADTLAPNVISRSPVNNSTNVPVNTTVVVGFDEDITNANATTIQLVAGSAVPATVGYQGAPMFRATLTPSGQLAPNTTYTVALSSTLQDSSNNLFGTPPTVWMFTTGADTIAPAVASTAPADNAIDVPLDATISVTFDEPVTGVDGTSFVVMNAGTGTLASSNGDRTWTFTPDAALSANTTVTIMLTMAIEDTTGNALVPFAFDFTTLP